MKRLLAIAAILASLALVACGEDEVPSDAAAAPQAGESDGTATEEVAARESKAGGRKAREGKARETDDSDTELVASESDYGSVLYDSERRAIYLFDKESSRESECYGACAEAWPPVVTDGEPRAASGVEAKLLGTTERDDGSTQVTYAGHPLYYYVDDPPGEILCQGVEEFGGLWLVVRPSGEAVR